MDHGAGLRDRLHDHVALDEIELYAEVLIAVAGADQRLSTDEIDRALGLSPETEEGAIVAHPSSKGHRSPPRVAEPAPASTPVPRPPAPRSGETDNPFGLPPLSEPGDHHSSSFPWVLPRPPGDVRTLHSPHDPFPYRITPWYV